MQASFLMLSYFLITFPPLGIKKKFLIFWNSFVVFLSLIGISVKQQWVQESNFSVCLIIILAVKFLTPLPNFSEPKFLFPISWDTNSHLIFLMKFTKLDFDTFTYRMIWQNIKAETNPFASSILKMPGHLIETVRGLQRTFTMYVRFRKTDGMKLKSRKIYTQKETCYLKVSPRNYV